MPPTRARDSQRAPRVVQICTALLVYPRAMKHGAGIEWDDLRCFLHAARAESLSGAARALGVEHSTMGRRISRLEASLGAALVHRGPTGLELTASGRRVFRLVAKMEAAAAAIDAVVVATRAVVRIVVPTGFAAILTSRLDALSGVALDIVSSARKVDLGRGGADVAIRVGPVDEPRSSSAALARWLLRSTARGATLRAGAAL